MKEESREYGTIMQAIQPAPPIQSPVQDMNADNDLRAQLAAVINPSNTHGYSNDLPASSPSPQHGLHIDPAIAGGQQDMMSGSAGDSGGDDSVGDGRKGAGKRALSQSKRAAQNRAAQRAFRQRKEGYIKKLEEQVRELHALEDNYKAIQTENYSLREYIIHLQSRLIESHGEYPQPPANVNLAHPREDPMGQLHRHADVPTAPMGMTAMSALQASAAQAVADLGAKSKRQQQDEAYMVPAKRFRPQENSDDPSEELSRQLQADTGGRPA